MRATRLIIVLTTLAGLSMPACAPLAGDTQNGTHGTPHKQSASSSQIEYGRYLTRAGDCASCHTAPGGKPFAGGLPIATPFGVIYSPNITPDPDTGIGKWSDADFYKAMHEGVTRSGRYLYPAFPYPWFTKVTPKDVQAIKAYLDTLPPVHEKTRPPEFPWPLSWRKSMFGWNTLFFHAGTFKPDPGKSIQWNRGAYLVQGLAHCGACHSSKNMLGAAKTSAGLGGGDAGDGWYAPDLASDLRDGLGKWSQQEIVEYLKTGSNARTAAAGKMAQVVENSTRYLSDADLKAIAVYLKDMPPKESAPAGEALNVNDPSVKRGAGLFIDNCAGCHMADGGGISEVFPRFNGSAAIQAKNPDSVIHIVLDGAKVPATSSKPAGFTMPAFGWKFTDQQVADIVNYIRNTWGNRAPLTNAGAVAAVRKTARQTGGK